MTAELMTCSFCECDDLEPDSNFCRICGHSVTAAPRPAAPEGWQSVPTKLTEEMERAAEQSWATGSEPNWRAWLRMIYDVLLAAAPRPTAPAGIKKAAEQMDWQQVVLNGGPPCFHLQDDGRFCGRAERWYGHLGDDPYHGFMSLVDLLSAAPSIPAPDEEQNTQRYSPCLEGTPELCKPGMRPDPEGEWVPHRAEDEEVVRLALGIAKETALSMLLPHAHKGEIDTSQFCDQGGREVQLLLLCGVLVRDPERPELVRIKDDA